MEWGPHGLNVTVATDQCFGLGHGSEYQKDDVVRIADVGQALGCACFLVSLPLRYLKAKSEPRAQQQSKTACP